jgi:hypothetical protein
LDHHRINSPFNKRVIAGKTSEIAPRIVPWSDEWRAERPMRDLAARLKMYRYGTGTIDVKKISATAWGNVRQAQRAFRSPTPHRPPQYETSSNARECCFFGRHFPKRNDGNYKHRLEEGYWPELDKNPAM